ncbi:hypothetical protein F4802DRAFT_596137 [Xylaria palmicola]|nr:hypothetical protein F4802DRAFT_596137 [Xylaria palmicola]
MATPGLMFVASRVRDRRKTSDVLYNRFYNEEHLPDVLASSQTKLALRYKNLSGDGDNATLPYLALYPVDDAAIIGSPESLKRLEDTKKSRILGCDDIFDLIHFELRAYEKIQAYEASGHENASGLERGRMLSCVAIEPAEGHDGDLDKWYRKEHLDKLAKCGGFRRCTRYRRMDGVCPRFLALMELDCTPEYFAPTQDEASHIVETEWSKRILSAAKVHHQELFMLIEAQGDTYRKL